MQLCDAFDLPIVTLCDTPGMMVGPGRRGRPALVRHCSRLFVTGANVTVPTGDDRAAQGLRARRPGDDGRHRRRRRWPAWPGRRASSAGWASRARCASATASELAAVDDPDAREELFQRARRPDVRGRQGAERGVATSRSTTSSTRPTPAAGSPPLLDAAGDPPAAHRQEAPEHRHLVIVAASAAALAVVAVVAGAAHRAARGRLRVRARRRAAAVGRARSHDAVVVALTLATFTNGYQAWTGRARRRPAGGRPAARRRRRRPAARAASCSCVADERVLGVVIGVAVLAAVVVIGLGLDLRHAGPGPRRRRRRAVRRADDVVGRQRPAAGVRPAGPPLRAGAVPGDDHDRSSSSSTSSAWSSFTATGDLDGDVARRGRGVAPRPGRSAPPPASSCAATSTPAASACLVLALLTVAGISALAKAIAG